MTTSTLARRWVAAPVSGGLVLVLLLGAVGAGLRIPGLTYLSGLPGFGLLDYRTLSTGEFLPLRAGYVDALLGTSLDRRARQQDRTIAASTAAAGGPVVPRGFAPLDPPGAATAGAAAVDHPFTNDDMASPRVITALPFSGRTNTRNASREPGEPAECAPTGGTAWYSYTARHDGELLADTLGSDHPTAVAAYRRSSTTGPPVHLGCSSQTGGLHVPAVQGTTYLFQVTGLLGGGSLVFSLRALGRTERVSTETNGRNPHEVALNAAISGDGRFAAYASRPTEACLFYLPCPGHVLVVDRRTGASTVVSRHANGDVGNAKSFLPSLSHDGRWVGFSSAASNLIDDDRNGNVDFFVHDRRTGRTVRATVDSAGREGSTGGQATASMWGKLTPDGRFAIIQTEMGGLVADDPPGTSDVFVRDLRLGITTRESVDSQGRPTPDGRNYDGEVSDDGRYVTFSSQATSLDTSVGYGACRRLLTPSVGTHKCRNVFHRDRWTGRTRIVSADKGGMADGHVTQHSMSGDGMVVAWTSTAARMVEHDTNGASDVFVVDLRRGTVRRASVNSKGEQQEEAGAREAQANLGSLAVVNHTLDVSPDGRRVAFDSRAANLVRGDTNGRSDVFVHDLVTRRTSLLSVSSRGEQGNGDSYRPALSRDGSAACFESDATNLAADDNRLVDVFCHDLGSV